MNYKEAYFSHECQHHDGLINFFESHQEIKVLKVELMEGSDIKRKEVQKIFQEAGFSAFSTFVTGLEITDPTCNKGDAIKEYLEKFKGVKSYGIGDETNDLPMFAAVDVSVAVSNATEEVRAVCQVQARACNDGGVGHFINEVVLLKK